MHCQPNSYLFQFLSYSENSLFPVGNKFLQVLVSKLLSSSAFSGTLSAALCLKHYTANIRIQEKFLKKVKRQDKIFNLPNLAFMSTFSADFLPGLRPRLPDSFLWGPPCSNEKQTWYVSFKLEYYYFIHSQLKGTDKIKTPYKNKILYAFALKLRKQYLCMYYFICNFILNITNTIII